jgi:ATP-dependent Clp protease ATP-binding subunit ClpC
LCKKNQLLPSELKPIEDVLKQISQVLNEDDETLLNKRILTLDLGSLVAGTKYRGQFEERVKSIINELKSNRDIIIFIDVAH